MCVFRVYASNRQNISTLKLTTRSESKALAKLKGYKYGCIIRNDSKPYEVHHKNWDIVFKAAR